MARLKQLADAIEQAHLYDGAIVMVDATGGNDRTILRHERFHVTLR